MLGPLDRPLHTLSGSLGSATSEAGALSLGFPLCDRTVGHLPHGVLETSLAAVSLPCLLSQSWEGTEQGPGAPSGMVLCEGGAGKIALPSCTYSQEDLP